MHPDKMTDIEPPDQCCCCGDKIEHGLYHKGEDPWEGEGLDDYCHICRLCRCDARPGECSK